MTIHWNAVEQYVTVLLFFNFIQFVNLSILDLAVSGVKGPLFNAHSDQAVSGVKGPLFNSHSDHIDVKL